MNKNFKNKILSIVVAVALFTTMGASWALGWFWRAVYPVITDITGLSPDQDQFWYGYWYGNYGWWYGYWYGYWYGDTYDMGYYTSVISNVDTSVYSGATVVINNTDLASKLVVVDGWINVTEAVKISMAWLGMVTLPDWLRITGSTTLPTLQDNSSVTSPTGTKRGSVRFWVPNAMLKFNVPVKIDIPVTSGSNVFVTVKHYDSSTSSTLSTTPGACNTNGTQVWGNSTISATVSGWYATIYTCSASDFVAYTSSSWGGWGGWGWSIIIPPSSSNSWTTSTWSTSTGSENNGGVNLPWDVNVVVDDNGNVVITKPDWSQVTFSDINNTFAKQYIAKLAALGIINWYEDGTFRPENNASRAEYLKIVLRAMWVNYDDADVSKLTFKDVSKDSWIAKVVVKASELGMIDSSNTNFRPNDSVTRAEAMKMLLNSASIEVNEVTTSSFADVKVTGWEAKYIETAKDLWIVDGQVINWKLMFRPFSNITRAEVSKIVVKTMETKPMN
jgi:hypothetical protein